MSDRVKEFRELVHQVQAGSEEAAWTLVAEFGGTIRRAVRRSLSDTMRAKFDSIDFVQLVWSSLFRARDRLERFSDPAELAAYLMAMARNKVGMETRRVLLSKKRNASRETSLDQMIADDQADIRDSEPAPAEIAIARERWDELVRDQPVHCRRIIQLRLLGHTHEAIAEILGINESTVRRFLKKLLASASK